MLYSRRRSRLPPNEAPGAPRQPRSANVWPLLGRHQAELVSSGVQFVPIGRPHISRTSADEALKPTENVYFSTTHSIQATNIPASTNSAFSKILSMRTWSPEPIRRRATATVRIARRQKSSRANSQTCSQMHQQHRGLELLSSTRPDPCNARNGLNLQFKLWPVPWERLQEEAAGRGKKTHFVPMH